MKKKGIKFIICFIIILAFGGYVFFVGWTQFKVEPFNVGIIVSKTNGINENIVENGKFSWNWEFLLPTNAQLKIFSIKPYHINIKKEGYLPSGKFYSQLFRDNNPDFSYDFDLLIDLSVTKEDILALLKNGTISDQESLEEYLNLICEEIGKLSVDAIIQHDLVTDILIPDSVDIWKLLSEKQDFSNFKNVKIEKVSFAKTPKIPDVKFYKKVKESNIAFSDENYNSKLAQLISEIQKN